MTPVSGRPSRSRPRRIRRGGVADERREARRRNPAGGRSHPRPGRAAVRVVIADDSVLLREALVRLLLAEAIDVVEGWATATRSRGGRSASSIFARLRLLPGDDENRRVRAVLSCLEGTRGSDPA